MQLVAGSRLGPYEILSALGVGGMGEVYRARDPRIGREVAVKVLPAQFVHDAGRLHRFELEVRATGALNHPNILSVHDVGTDNATPYIVSELLEGETLRHRLENEPISQRKVIEYAIQIARGLAAAHDKGIAHRDLKPENLFLTKDGRVKILDFGLAKLTQPEPNREEQSSLKTATADSTPGTVLGTVGYMSPEQVRGRPTDHRSDIFTFGAILYEMFTGKRAFRGDTAADTMSSILSKDPPQLNESNPDLPPAITRILRHTLEKNPEERLQSMHDLAIYLEALSDVSGTTSSPVVTKRFSPGKLIYLAVTAIVTVAALFFAFGYFQRVPKADHAIRMSINSPTGGSFGTTPVPLALSPDGQTLVFERDGKLWKRELKDPIAHPLAGVDGLQLYPFWSPDGRFVGFFADGKLKVIDVDSGSIRIICDANAGRGGTWNSLDTIVFAPDLYGGLHQVSAQGGVSKLVTDQPEKQRSYRWPQFLPDSNHFIFIGYNPPAIYLSSLTSPEKKILMQGESNVLFAAPNYLLSVKNGKLFADELDLKNFRIKRKDIPISKDYVAFNRTRAFGAFTVSQTGLLAYQADQVGPSSFFWIDRTGKQLAAVGDPEYYTSPRLSPDQKRIAVMRHPIHSQEGDVWVYDLSKNNMIRLTQTLVYEYPVRQLWSSDGTNVYFATDRGLFKVDSSGASPPQQIFPIRFGSITAEDVSPDGKFLLINVQDEKTDDDIWLFSLQGESKITPLLKTRFPEANSTFSPDGKWIAYGSDESGRNEIYVRPFPNVTSARWQVSSAGGFFPQWRKDGKELFFISRDNRLMAVDVRLSAGFESGTAKALFEMPEATLDDDFPYDVSSDGQRFLLCAPPGSRHYSTITVTLNWKAELKQ